jgi:5-methylcytosine-specific restriction endonuclease McrA
MAREKNPAFQFYPKDWLTDDKVQAMSLSERGLYITLLCHAWLHGSIPDTELVLSRITNVRRDLFKRLWKGQLKSCFITSSVGRLINPRLERERAKQAFFRELRAAAGRRSGETRQAKLKQPVDRFVQTKGQAKSKYAFPYSSTSTLPLPLSASAEKGPCAYCGATPAQTGRVHEWDHFLPRRAGGSDDASNLVLACHVCNQAKQGRIFATLDEARRWLHRAYWASNRQRWIRHRAIAFGGQPPVDVAPTTRPLTRDEKQHAERVLKNRFGRCHHHPRCANHAACVQRLAAELREQRKASR